MCLGRVIIASLCKLWSVALTVCICAHLSVSMATTRPHRTIAEVLAMTEEDLRIECLRLEISASGLDKSVIQRQVFGHLVAKATSTPASQTRAPPAYAAVNTEPLEPGQRVSTQKTTTWRSRTTKKKTCNKRTMTFRTPCTPDLAREIPFSILLMTRMLPLPTRAHE